jgi:hypothetical protein
LCRRHFHTFVPFTSLSPHRTHTNSAKLFLIKFVVFVHFLGIRTRDLWDMEVEVDIWAARV